MTDVVAPFPDRDQPCYVISVAARMVGLPAQTLRYYEREGLVRPSRSRGRIRLYSQSDVERLQRIKTMMNDMGVNLAGVEVILRLLRRIEELEQQLVRFQSAQDSAQPHQAGLIGR